MDLSFADDISGFGPSAMANGDPRLKYTEKAKEEGKGLDDQPLPYDPNKKGSMDSMEVLKNLTQVDGIEETKTDESRCAANAVLAMAVMKGPGGIEHLSKQLDERFLDAAYKKGDISPERRAQLEQAYIDSGVAAFRVKNGIGTYGDLSKIADAMKIIMTSAPDAKTTGHEAVEMAKLVGPTTKSGVGLEGEQEFHDHFTEGNNLAKGESRLLNVDTDVYKGGKRSFDDANHFVTVSKDPSGRTFIYDPYPREGSQIIYEGDPGYSAYFANEKGQSKAGVIVSKTK